METTTNTTAYPDFLWDAFRDEAPPRDSNLDDKLTIAVAEYVLEHCDGQLDDKREQRIQELTIHE